ncbi:MAG: ComEC family competence protein [Gemmataceae bacterium]|nr:ComEC family competence protein [Gemmataceae bacterium]
MSSALPHPVSSPAPPPEPAWKEFARAPLVPIALAASVGLVLDRYGQPALGADLVAAVLALVLWVSTRTRKPLLAPVWLWISAGALAAAHHNAHRNGFADDDVGTFAPERPTPAKIRGTLDEEPARFRPPKPDPLFATPKVETTVTVLAVTAIETPQGWRPASGRARLTVEGRLDDLHHGDAVEVVGRLFAPSAPGNPGEMDYRSHLLDQRITAELRTKRSRDGITRLEEGWRTSVFGQLAVVRSWGTRSLQASLPEDGAGLAAALLLGDGTALDRDEWDSYVRTGVVHVLAISGQHLVVLAAFVWTLLKIAGIRRRDGAWVVAAVLIGYALLTGGRPSAMRAAVMVTVVCGGIVLRRPKMPANAFALGWLVVAGLNPADPFTAGCQLSFLSVFVLIWGVGRWLTPRPLTPLEALVEESRPLAEKIVRRLVRVVAGAYAISLILGVANAPLILAWQNLISPVGIVIGPPLVLLTSIALIAGFLLLLVSPLGTWATSPFTLVVWLCLAGCEKLVHAVEGVPGGWVYAPGPAWWWLVGFYLGVTGVVLFDGRWRGRCLLGLAVWVVLGLLATFDRPARDEMRVTFLAVGHGGCVVVETPDGRVLLYDTGTTTGPDVVRRVIAPYLWSRGITRVDEVFLSHADLDHFNGLPELLKRFPVGQVTLTPSFAEKPSPGVATTLGALDRHGVRQRVATAGDRYTAGEVTLEVLHPPPEGPAGNENARSLVLLVRHAGHTVLLTGDLEEAGQEMVVGVPVPPIDVLLAPHHGAVAANARRGGEGRYTPGPVAGWARPQLVVSCQAPRPTDHLTAAYGAAGGTVWDTATAGAVTVRSHPTGLVAETFRTGEVRVIRRGGR